MGRSRLAIIGEVTGEHCVHDNPKDGTAMTPMGWNSTRRMKENP